MSDNQAPKTARQRPVLLAVLDGFGLRDAAPDNATSVAAMPVFHAAWEKYPHAALEASGLDVGLPEGQIGNSEVGHMNLGAGRVVFQDLPLIDRAIASGALAQNPALAIFIGKLKASDGRCHLMGLASPGGVHAHQKHMVALAKLLAAAGVPVCVHAFLDGRDVPPQSADAQIAQLQQELSPLPGVQIVTLCGRYFAMDRDKRWDRVAKAYDLLVSGQGQKVSDPVAAIKASYADGKGDEFVEPCVLPGYDGMKDGDGVLFANFRTDRAREILLALLDPAFDGFARPRQVSFAAALGMVPYSDKLDTFMPALFPPKAIDNGLGAVVSAAGLKQLRIAETEKYPHVTFFFNGGREEPYPGEERIMVPSPKVATYDLQPAMSAQQVTDQVVAAIESGTFDLIVLNYANPDMVGHTGVLSAAVSALETLDTCLGRVLAALDKAGGVALVTADHGNCEVMTDPATHGPHTAHTLNKVPVMLIGAGPVRLRDGRLADVAPTLLPFLGLKKPPEMDGDSLVLP